MDTTFVTAALDSTFKVLNTMAKMKPVPGQPKIKQGECSQGAVTGIMDMASPKAKGALSLSFSESVILDIAKRMLGESPSSIDETAKDLAGELVNMVVGGAKATLAEKGYDFDMSTPAVYVGEEVAIKPRHPGQTITLPFETPCGEFYLEFTYAD